MAGNAGNDTYVVDDAGDTVGEGSNNGTDEVRTTLASYTLAANVENLRGLAATGQALAGNGLANTILGGGGVDMLTGGGGNDTLDGGARGDGMAGGAGDDRYLVDSTGDTVVEDTNAGIDEVRTALARYTLTANVEKLVALSGAGQSLTGNALANTITGAAGNDQLDGGAGADVLAGGSGNDSYVVDDAGDVVTELPGGGNDRVASTVDYVLGADVESLTLRGAALLGTGNGLDNGILGTSGKNTLLGLDGSDTLSGNSGNDVLDGGNGDDVLTGGFNKDTMTGGTGLDQFAFGEGETAAPRGAADVIMDFNHAEADRIKLNLIDADTTLAGDQKFIFLKAGAFTGVAGQLHYVQDGGSTFVEGDTNGDGLADFTIKLVGLINLVGADFVL
jgi:Ca2+-binding RTX toxin-like protein